MAFFSTLFVLLSSLSLLMIIANSQPDVTSFQIDSFNYLTYERDAFIPSGSSYVNLIANTPSGTPKTSSVGRVLYSNPIKFSDEGRQASFECTMRFSITPIDNGPADGMTFFIVPVNSTVSTGGGGGNLGIFYAVHTGSPIFAVEFDAFVNSGVDPNYRHIGIDINSAVSKNTTNFENAIGKSVVARINYDAPTRRISVVATYGSETSTVEYVYNLKTLLPQQVQVGISASTGPTRAAIFKVFTWYFTSTMVADNRNVNEDTTYIKQYVE